MSDEVPKSMYMQTWEKIAGLLIAFATIMLMIAFSPSGSGNWWLITAGIGLMSNRSAAA